MKIEGRGLFAAVALLVSVPVGAKTLYATDANFKMVFAGAVAGDTIRLSGTFGRTALQGRSFASTVTLDARKATFTDTLSLSKVSGVRVLGGRYGNATAAVAVGIRISGSDRILISAPVIVGNATSSHGIDVGTSSNVTVDGGTFTGLRLGVGFIAVTNGKITNNKSIRSSSDGFNVVDSHGVLVSRNSCSGTSITPGAHPDCVQLWSIRGNAVQSDIVISDNTATGATQGFTSFNGSDGGGLRIQMLRNRVDTSYPQGIACYECVDSVFRDNVLTTQAGAKWVTTMNIVGGRNNTISGNSIGAKPAAAGTARGFAAFAPDDSLDSYNGFLDYDGGDMVVPGASAKLPVVDAVVAVPEPGTWLLLIAGFGLTGLAVRRRREVLRPA